MKKKLIQFGLVFILLFSGVLVFGDIGVVAGTVSDKVTGKGLPAQIKYQIFGRTRKLTCKLPGGAFVLNVYASSGFIFEVSMKGYKTKRIGPINVPSLRNGGIVNFPRIKLEKLAPVVHSAWPNKIITRIRDVKGIVTLKGENFQYIKSFSLNSPDRRTGFAPKILSRSSNQIKIDLNTGVSIYSTNPNSPWKVQGVCLLSFIWDRGNYSFQRVYIPPSKFYLSFGSMSTYKPTARRAPFDPNRNLRKPLTIKRSRVILSIPTVFGKRYKTGLTIPVKWQYQNFFSVIVNRVRVNIEVLNAVSRRKIGIIARNIPLSARVFNWKAGKLLYGYLRINQNYILQIVTTNNVKSNQIAFTLL